MGWIEAAVVESQGKDARSGSHALRVVRMANGSVDAAITDDRTSCAKSQGRDARSDVHHWMKAWPATPFREAAGTDGRTYMECGPDVRSTLWITWLRSKNTM